MEKIETSNNYVAFIYPFKFFPKINENNNKNNNEKNNTNNEIMLKHKYNKSKFISKMTNLALNNNNFLFDLIFNSTNFLFKPAPPITFYLEPLEQFNYFINYLINNHLDKNCLILSRQKLLKGYIKYDIITYLKIFMECLLKETIQEHLDLFNQVKI